MKRHDFSMVFNDEQIVILEKIIRFTGHRDINNLVSFLVIFMKPYLKVKHYKLISARKTYETINWTKKLHIKLWKSDYRFLKLLHANLKTHSIAWIIRDILKIVFKFFSVYGDSCFEELKKQLKLVKSGPSINRKQNIQREFPLILHYFIEYNNKYEAIRIYHGQNYP